MPTKNLPSRVNFSLRGGRMRRRHAASHCANALGPDGEPFMAARGLSERHGDATHDLPKGGLRLIPSGNEAVGLRGEADTVGEDRHGQLVDVVSDAIVTPAKERARTGSVAERH